jgi:hypothetical protein
MQKINGISTAAISTAELNSVMDEGRGRDRQKADRELTARAKRTVNLSVVRGPLDIECPHCGQPAGEPCLTASGGISKNHHKARITAVAKLNGH